MNAASIMQLEGRFSRAYAFLCLLAINFILRANETSSISEVEESIAIDAFVVITKEWFHRWTGAFLCFGVHLEALRASETSESIIVPEIWLRACNT